MKEMQNKHTITVTDRESVSLTGIDEVVSYDENNIVMQTNMGQLTLDGSGLNIVKLNLGEGEVVVQGKVDALYYIESGGKRSVFSRLFG